MAHEEQKEQVIWACNELTRLGLTAGTAGNVSVRVPDTELVAVSPSSVPYHTLTNEDIVIVDLQTGDSVEGFRNPTSELLLHSAVHTTRPDVQAVVHSHCLHVTALTLLGRGIPAVMDEQIAILGGDISCTPHQLPGSQGFADAVVEHLGDRRAVLLSNHGMVGVGRDIAQAITVCHMTERLAQIMLLVLPHGEPGTIPEETQKLERMYYEMGIKPRRKLVG